MSDYDDRGAYTPPSDRLAFDPRQPVRGGGPAPVTLVVSALALVGVVGGVFFLYRDGFRHRGEAPALVGAPVADVRSPAATARGRERRAGRPRPRQDGGLGPAARARRRAAAAFATGGRRRAAGRAVSRPAGRRPARATAAPGGDARTRGGAERRPGADPGSSSSRSCPRQCAAWRSPPLQRPRNTPPRAMRRRSPSPASPTTRWPIIRGRPSGRRTTIRRRAPVSPRRQTRSLPPASRHAIAVRIKGAQAAPAPNAAANRSAAWVQIGAFSSQTLAEQGWRDVARIERDSMAGKGRAVQPIERDDGATLYRTYVTGFGSVTAARAFCAELRAAARACLVK